MTRRSISGALLPYVVYGGLWVYMGQPNNTVCLYLVA